MKQRNKLKAILIIVLLSSLYLFTFSAEGMLYESHDSGDTSAQLGGQGATWCMQTFTVGSIEHNISSIKLKMYRTGTPGSLTVSIKATSEGNPTGGDLTSGSINTNGFTTSTTGEWYEIFLNEITLSANTQYAIITRAPNGDLSNFFNWRTSPGLYANGNAAYSEDSGYSWTHRIDLDGLFQIYGPDIAPVFSNVAHDNTLAGESTLFSSYWNDEVASLSHYIFSTNNTGSWQNDTATAFSGTPSWANVSKTLNSTVGLTIGYRWYANNSLNGWSSTSIQTLVTSEFTPPTYSDIGHIGATGGVSASFYMYANDNVELGTYIFSYKIGEGSYTNLTGTSFASTPGWANLSRTLPTQNTTFYFKYFFSDSFGNWNTTSEESFAVTYVSEPTPTATPTAEPTATPAATPTPAPIIVGDTSNLYFRSDTYETLNVSAYGLDSDFTDTQVTSNTASDIDLVQYGIRVYLVTSANESTELTSTYSARMTLTSNSTGNYTGYVNGYWTIPRTTVVLGYQALQVDVYSYTPTYGWNLEHSFISGVLMTKEIVSSQLTFKLYVNISFLEPGELGGTGDVFCSYVFGDVDHKSGIYGLSVTTPTQSEIELWRLNSGDYVGFVVGAYYDVIGAGFYALLLLLFAGVLYFRYGHFGVVAVFFVLFGGVGGLVWLFLPLWAAGVAAAFIIFGTTFIVWRVIR